MGACRDLFYVQCSQCIAHHGLVDLLGKRTIPCTDCMHEMIQVSPIQVAIVGILHMSVPLDPCLDQVVGVVKSYQVSWIVLVTYFLSKPL